MMKISTKQYINYFFVEGGLSKTKKEYFLH
jgi:hypothetical protein